jgi:predicted DNA-binding antitoxin AbrB/MazE fold protein
MVTTIEAVFDGTVLRPKQPLALAPNTSVRITIEIDPAAAPATSFLRTARTLKLDAPPDLATNLDTYLYGEAPDGIH